MRTKAVDVVTRAVDWAGVSVMSYDLRPAITDMSNGARRGSAPETGNVVVCTLVGGATHGVICLFPMSWWVVI